jgi:arylsulfatase A-like enzyme
LPAAVRRLFAALLACGLLAACSRRGEEPAPHLLLVSIDTLRRDALRAYAPGAQPLPAFDALAARSVRFDRALSTAAWTLPAHASLLTGVYPHRHGAVHRLATLSAEVPTVAETLAARGYDTVAFTGGGFVDPSYGLGRGFHRYQVVERSSVDGDGEAAATGASALVAATDYLEARPVGGAPLLLFVHTYAVHDYFLRRPATDPPAPADAPPDPRAGWRAEQRNIPCLLGGRRCEPAEWSALRQLYAEEVRRADAPFGSLLAAAERRLSDRPLWIVFTSDHGEGFSPERGDIHHGGTLTPDLVAVPLLVAPPGDRPLHEVTEPVSLVDVAPTLLALAGAADGVLRDGTSLTPLLRGEAAGVLRRRALARRLVAAEEHYYLWRDGHRHSARDVQERPLAVSVLQGPWWYLRTRRSEEVFVLSDGGQRDRDAARRSAPLSALRRAARPWVENRATPTAPRDEDPELDARLESLGYGG